MTRKNIKVPEDLFLALRDDKDDEQSWPHYLESECLQSSDIPPGLRRVIEATEDDLETIKSRIAESPHPDAEPQGRPQTDKVVEELRPLREAVETVEERTGRIEKTLEEVTGR